LGFCPELKTVVFRGKTARDITSSSPGDPFNGTKVTNFFVPDDYDQQKFMGYGFHYCNYSIDSNPGFRLKQIDGETYVIRDKFEDYPHTSCGVVLCNDSTGYAYTKEEALMAYGCVSGVCGNINSGGKWRNCTKTPWCMKEKCVDEKTIEQLEKSRVHIVVEISENNSVVVNTIETENELKQQVDDDSLTVATNVNKEGDVVKIIVFVKDTKTANKTVVSLNENAEKCQKSHN